MVGVVLMSTSAGRLAEVTLGLPAAAARLLHRAAPGVLSMLGRAPRLVELGRRTGNDLGSLLTRHLLLLLRRARRRWSTSSRR